MDHKVSKDMISSGMIPSGEKTQADLGRTQYGSTPSPSKLMDAYKSMYEHHQKDKDGNTIPHEGEELNELSKETLGRYVKTASFRNKHQVGKKYDDRKKSIEKAEKKIKEALAKKKQESTS